MSYIIYEAIALDFKNKTLSQEEFNLYINDLYKRFILFGDHGLDYFDYLIHHQKKINETIKNKYYYNE